MSKTSDLRVISGRFRGRILKSPQDSHTHPMGAREKLALFNMVNVEQAHVLDAFAGSGALGIEALSRGADEVVFVESNAKVASAIKSNLQTLDIASAQVFTTKVANFVTNSEFYQYFDVIFADPPYDKVSLDELSQLANLLKADGTLALSTPVEQGSIEFPGLRTVSTHTYARAQITIYRKA